MKKRMIFAAVAALLFASIAGAEIEKMSIVGDRCLRLYWWPKVAAPLGWHHEREYSLKYRVNAMAPDGFTFADAETVMYAKAEYKPSMPETTSVEMVIANDKGTFLATEPSLTITEVSPCATQNGQKLRSFTFFPKEKGNWERVSYGEEGEFFLIFTLSSRTKSGFDRSVSSYEAMISQYVEKPS